MGRIVVLALGGNALTHHGQAGTQEQLEANAEAMARSISSLMLAGWEVVLVHGNGPQVGNLALQQEEGSDVVPPQPLFSLGAMTQGQLGSLFALALRKVLGPKAPEVVPLVTHSEVDPHDPAFADPTKPIGPRRSGTSTSRVSIRDSSPGRRSRCGTGSWPEQPPGPSA